MPDNEELSVTTPAGSLKFKGAQMFPVILVILLSVIFGGLSYFSNAKADDRAIQSNTALHELKTANVTALQELKAATERAEATQRAMIYVISLSQTERERLNLMKPKELAEMQR